MIYQSLLEGDDVHLAFACFTLSQFVDFSRSSLDKFF